MTEFARSPGISDNEEGEKKGKKERRKNAH